MSCKLNRMKKKDTHPCNYLSGKSKPQNVNKPVTGHFEKAELAPERRLKEFRLEDSASYEVGQEIKADVFCCGRSRRHKRRK